MAKKKQGNKSKADIFREAFEATGTLEESDNKAPEKWINDNYSDFSWGKSPTTEISAARSQEKKRQGIATGGPSRGKVAASGGITAKEIEEARALADDFGGTEQTIKTIDALLKTDIKRLKAALRKWDDMVEAAGGDAAIAEKFLDLMG